MKRQFKPKNQQEAPGMISAPTSPQAKRSGPDLMRFSIVGIGASAGGLEALEQFLRQVPEGSGLAFVIVQHLDPTRAGYLPELLQRATGMEVLLAGDRMRVKPNSVYVIPPNKDLSILHGVLHLVKPALPRGQRFPIDYFFRALAEDQQDRSVGVILTGMGSDGTIGLKAIKEKEGLTVVQEPASAKFESMPRSALDAGLADLVAPVEELPGKIIDLLSHNRRAEVGAELPLDEQHRGSLGNIITLLRSRTGHDFSMYKTGSMYRRIERRIGLHHLDGIAGYVSYLQENPQELELLFKELLIGVTSFFRDPAEWAILKGDAIPRLLAARPAGGVLRAWSAGCSTGEEAYSLAIIFKEALEEVQPAGSFTLQIFATNPDRDAIDRARLGVYPADIATDVSPERLRRYFVPDGNGYRVGKEIRQMVTFATHNVISDPPFGKLDILICRNLLIYLTSEIQKKILSHFNYSLNPDGVLFLGSAESVGTSSDLFTPLGKTSRLYQRTPSRPRIPAAIPDGFGPVRPPSGKGAVPEPAVSLQSLADRVLLQQFSPSAVLVNWKGDILYTSGRTGHYLEPAAGKANWNVFAMVREELRLDLENAFKKALRQNEPVTLTGGTAGQGAISQSVDLTVQLLQEPEELSGKLMIVFSDPKGPSGEKSRGRSRSPRSDKAAGPGFDLELLECQEELHTTQSGMNFAQSEFTAINEELQSLNEELVTSGEEMQSMNEEMQSVNAEQRAKLDQLSRVNNDLRNLLDATDIITVFLDDELRVRRFTAGADQLFRLIPSDLGRPLSDIASDLRYPDMTKAALETRRTLVFSEEQIATADGRWFKVRIMPYRTTEDEIDGVVMTFSDITAAKALEAQLREENARLNALIARHP
jgi:chemotaxis methyl-accepting protein methylase